MKQASNTLHEKTRSGQGTSEKKLRGMRKILGILSKLIPRTIRIQRNIISEKLT
jgi:hypothetical protein